MAKKMTAFFCQGCGYESSKWMGQCPGCREWNSFVEEPVKDTKSGGVQRRGIGTNKPVLLKEVSADNEERFLTHI